MVAALKAEGVPVGYFLSEGEQHGFRKAENIRRALDAELGLVRRDDPVLRALEEDRWR